MLKSWSIEGGSSSTDQRHWWNQRHSLCSPVDLRGWQSASHRDFQAYQSHYGQWILCPLIWR